jgi:hypothetical protein
MASLPNRQMMLMVSKQVKANVKVFNGGAPRLYRLFLEPPDQ